VESESFGTPAAAQKTGLTLPLPLQFLAAWLAVWLGRVLQEQVDFLKAENRLLREKLGGKRIRLTDAERRRLAMLSQRLGRRGLAAVAMIASPEAILCWYRDLVARKYDGSERRGPGFPKKRGEIAEMVLRVARENETWGYTRIKGALQNLGQKIGRNTIKRILREHGIDPAPERGRHMPWAKFIKAHVGALVGMDFFAVEVVRWLGLVRYHVLFGIDVTSRKVEILGSVVNPGGAWMEQIARNLVDAVDGFLLGKRYVLADRDPLYTQGFREILKPGGVKVFAVAGEESESECFRGAIRAVRQDRMPGPDRTVGGKAPPTGAS
jgi:putative transposase